MTTNRTFQQFNSSLCVVLMALAFPVPSLAAPEDVNARVENGTLFIKRALGSTNGSFGVGIGLEGMLDESIRLYVNGNFQEEFARAGISAIELDADQSLVDFGSLALDGAFEFDGDISVNVRSGGFCSLNQLDLVGDLHLTGSAGRIRVEYRTAIIEGNVTLRGGPGADVFQSFDTGGFLAIDGEVHIDGGPGGEQIDLAFAWVTGDALIDLGPSSGNDDADACELSGCRFDGSVLIGGGEGNDNVFLVFTEIRGDFLVDMGNGEDQVFISGLTVSSDSMLFLDGGNGNSDSLFVLGFPIQANEFARFEAATIP